MSRAQWVSFHLFRAGPLDHFLKEALSPFVATVLAEGLASSFFFVRYWEVGPHIRLRLRTNAREPLVRRTRAHFERYFKTHPSVMRIDSHELVSFANDAVRESEYEPELIRYGGQKGVAVSERQFEASSRAVLGTMADREWSYQSAVGAAVHLHIMFANAMGFDLLGAARFFAGVSQRFAMTRGWLPAELTIDAATSQFAALFALQRDRLVAIHRDLWSALKEGQQFGQQWANRWVRDNFDVATCLRRARGLASAEPWTNAELAIMMSYVHMTNNRLGVLNGDEAYVAYILMRGFRGAA